MSLKNVVSDKNYSAESLTGAFLGVVGSVLFLTLPFTVYMVAHMINNKRTIGRFWE